MVLRDVEAWGVEVADEQTYIPVDAGEAEAIAEYYRLVAEYEYEEAEALAVQQQAAELEEATLLYETLECDPVWSAGVRYIYFVRRRGREREVELLTKRIGSELRAMVIRDGVPEVSRHVHPNRRVICALGSLLIDPDALANEILVDEPDDDRTGETLVTRAMRNWHTYCRYREAQYTASRSSRRDDL